MTTAPAIPAALRDWLSTKGLTARQHEVAAAFWSYHAEHGYAPRLDDMAEALGVCKVAASEHVESLIAKGVLGRRRYKARGLYLLWVPDGGATITPAAALSEIAALRGGIARAVSRLRRRADLSRTPEGRQNLPIRLEQLADDLADLLDRTEKKRRATA